MDEIRLHGLGGEGVVRLSELIGEAAVDEGNWAHSFPFFGTEIRGAAVKAFTRVDNKQITLRSYIYEPDILILTNEVLLENTDVTSGLKPTSLFILNSVLHKDQLESKYCCKVYPINATQIALDILGKPITNTIILGAFIGATSIISLDTAEMIIRKSFKGGSLAEKNVMALKKGYELLKEVA